MPFQWYKHIAAPPEETAEEQGVLRKIVSALLRPFEKVKHYGKALVGGTIYYYGNRIFWGGETSRYLYKRYRTIWQRMGFVRQAILAYKHRIASEIPKVLSSNKQIMTILEHRLKSLGLWEYYPEIAQDLIAYGDSFSEIIFSKPDYRVIGLKRLEPDYMYIQRDPYGRPLMYISVIDGIPVVIETYRMLHIKMDSQPGDAFGVGLIEGGMDDLAALRILEDLNIQLVKHNIYPHRVYMCPSDDISASVEGKLKQQKRFGDLVVPMGVKVQQMISGTGIDLRGFMLYYQQKFFLDAGVPMDMLIKGTGANRSTANEMQSAFNNNARAIQRQILLKLEWFCELLLASEGILANVTLVAPEIDKQVEFARRQEIRGLYQEGLICRDFAQELLGLRHPLNVVKVPEDLASRLNQERLWIDEFKTGLLTRPYAIKLLGHDVPENRPTQPPVPQFMMPLPGGGGAAPTATGGVVAGVPLGQPEDPEMLDPQEVKVVSPTGGNNAPASPPQGGGSSAGITPPSISSQGGAPPSPPTQVPKQFGNIKVARIGLQNINMSNNLEAVKMSKPNDVQTIYVRKRNERGEIEMQPYAAVDVKAPQQRAHIQADPRWATPDNQEPSKQENNSTNLKDMDLKPNNKKGEQPLKPTKAAHPEKGEAKPIDGDSGGLKTDINPIPIDQDPEPVEPMPAAPQEAAPAGMPPQGGEQEGGMPPQAGAQPSGGQQPQMPKPSPYFNPKSDQRPKFADIFGDNEYSIKKPQRHVEKVREELIDVYGQKHRRIHERVREHHKPFSGEDNDFIKKKKASAEKKWAKSKTRTPVKHSADMSLDGLTLVGIDMAINSAAHDWIRGLEDVLGLSIATSCQRIISSVKQLAKATLDTSIVPTLNAILSKEILMSYEYIASQIPVLLENINQAGNIYANDAFVSAVEARDTKHLSAILEESIKTRCILELANSATETIEQINTKPMDKVDFLATIIRLFDSTEVRIKNMAVSTGNAVYKDAISNVMLSPEIVQDIEYVEYITTSDTCCNTCNAHNMKRINVDRFTFEPCNTCNAIYRIHIKE